MKVDLGCGRKKEPGFIGVDAKDLPGVDIVQDIMVGPLPFKDESVDEIRMSHVLEHIPAGNCTLDLFNEIHRIMKPGGTMYIETPHWHHECAWSDPTHVREITPNSLNFLNWKLYWWGHHRCGPFEIQEVVNFFHPEDGANCLGFHLKKPTRFVDIIIPTWNRHDLLYQAIDSLEQNTTTPHNVIIIDNGSEPAVWHTLEGKGPLSIYRNDTNLGFIKATNQGLKISKASHVVLLNNDVLIPKMEPDWLEQMIRCFDEDANVGAVGPTSNFVLGLQNQEFDPLMSSHIHDTNLLIGFCMMLSRKAVDSVGLLDERFGLGGNDDLDYSIRMRSSGFKMRICRDVKIFHYGCQTTATMPGIDYAESNQKTRKVLVDKWGEDRVMECFQADKDIFTEAGLASMYERAIGDGL